MYIFFYYTGNIVQHGLNLYILNLPPNKQTVTVRSFSFHEREGAEF